MNKNALIYILCVIALGAALSLITVRQIDCCVTSNQYLLALFLVLLATGSQLGKVLYKSRGETGSGTSWYTPLLSFIFAGVFVLPPYMLVAVVVVPHLMEWAIERARKTPFLRAWYIQPFNIATHIICSLLAWEIYVVTTPILTTLLPGNLAAKLLASMLAGLVYLIMNHYLVGQVMVLACQVTWMQSGVLNLKNAACDAGFLLAGVGTALLMTLTPLVVLPLITLLLFMQRRLAVTLVRSSV